jgi:hypothetical protein
MHFTEQQLANFQRLYSQHFGQSISKKQAVYKGAKLVRFVKSVRLANDHQITIYDNNTNNIR